MTADIARYRWRLADIDRAAARQLAREAQLPTITAELLLLRGITTPEAAARFLTPRLDHLSDPFLMTGMRAAVERITRARNHQEKVLVFGDYDVDGIAATAILARGLQRFGVIQVETDLPDRLREGYGLMPDRVEQAARDGVALIITVDNGVCAFAAADKAGELGLDLIITDHHNLEDRLPAAAAVINPRLEPEDHPARGLCGAGVAFKLSMALNGTPNDLDITALGTVADIVPLLGENRILTALGLRHIAKHRRIGIEKLAREAGFDLDDISSEKIGFQLGPRLNAAGRLDDARVALELLLTECPDRASVIARALNHANEERRAIEKRIFDEAVEELDAFFREEQRVIVVAREDWHTGVIGIVAARLVSRYNRPVVMLNLEKDGVARGSARSIAGFDLMEALTACRTLFTKFGGHRAAAGMTMASDLAPALRDAMELEARRQLGDGPITPELAIDAMVSLAQIDNSLVKAMDQLKPYGQANPAPILAAFDVEVVPRSSKLLKEQHVSFAVRQNGATCSAIWFKMAERFFREDFPERIDIAFTPEPSLFASDTPVRLRVHDIRPARGSI